MPFVVRSLEDQFFLLESSFWSEGMALWIHSQLIYSYNMCPRVKTIWLDLQSNALWIANKSETKEPDNKKAFGYLGCILLCKIPSICFGTLTTKLHYSVLRSQASLNIRHDARIEVWTCLVSSQQHQQFKRQQSIWWHTGCHLSRNVMSSSEPWVMLWKCLILSWLPLLAVKTWPGRDAQKVQHLVKVLL